MAKSLLLVVFGLLSSVAGDDTSPAKILVETISTTVTVDWLFTSPGLASPTPEPNPVTIVSTIPYATYTPLTSSSEAYYPIPSEPSESDVSVATPTPSDSCEYQTVTSLAIVTPTTLVTTKAITITTMTTEAYSTIGEVTVGIDTSSLSYTQECQGKHDPDCRNNWGGLTASQPPAEEPPFTAVTSWKRNIKTMDSGDGVGNGEDLGFIGQEGHVGRSQGSHSEVWNLAALVAALGALAF